MDYRFRVEVLEEAKEFVDGLDEKTRQKMVYNFWKSRIVIDRELFKKLENEIWEFRTFYRKTYYRVFAFWDKTDKEDTIVLASHGIVKKTDRVSKSEIEKAERIRIKYFKNKNEKK